MTQSTCEAELLAYNEAYQVGEAMSALFTALGVKTEKKLFGDSKSALSLCTGETGHWRTRHLRLRASEKGVERDERRAASSGHTAKVLALVAGCLAATGQYGWEVAAAVGAVAATMRARRRGSAQAVLAQGDGRLSAQAEGLDQAQEGHGRYMRRCLSAL